MNATTCRVKDFSPARPLSRPLWRQCQRLHNLNPAMPAGDVLTVQPAAQHIKRHHCAHLLTDSLAVARGAEMYSQGESAVWRSQRKVEMFIFQTRNRQRQPGEMVSSAFRYPVRSLRQGFFLWKEPLHMPVMVPPREKVAKPASHR